jgi:Tol biopolymer transport system component
LLFSLVGCGEPPAPDNAQPASGLVFVRVVGESTEIIRARIADGEERAVTVTPDRDERWPYWSQQAKRLVFQVALPGERSSSDLVLWNPVSQRESPLPATPSREERWPSWSPDGRSIAFAFRGGVPSSGVALAFWRKRRITLVAKAESSDFYLRPNFSPDGRLLVAQRRIAEQAGSSNLWLLSADAKSDPRPLTSDPEWNDSKAWFSRDGTRIIYTRRAPAGSDYTIWGIAAAGGAPYPVVAAAGGGHSARPSPARDELAFVTDRDGSSDVYLAELDGSNQRSLQRTPAYNEFAPRWSPDGEFLVVTRVPADIADFGSMSPRALARALVVVLDRSGKQRFEAAGAMPAWMPAWP